MPHNTSIILLPTAFAASAAIFSAFGKRKAAPPKEAEPLEPLPTDTVMEEPTEAPPTTDEDGRTLPVLGLFGQGEEADKDTSGRVWNALSVPVKADSDDEPDATRFFGITAFDPAPEGQDAAVQTALKMAMAAAERGYTVLLMDVDLHRPTLHAHPIFHQDNTRENSVPNGIAEFLRGETSKLSALIKVASGKEGLLLLPAGKVVSSDTVLTGGATLDRLLRLASPFAEIVLLVVPPLMATPQSVDNTHVLPRMNGVLVAYPSGFSASSDTEALEKLEAMDVSEVGAIVTPPVSFADAPLVVESEVEIVEIPFEEEVSVTEMETMVSPDPIAAVEPDAEPEAAAVEEPTIIDWDAENTAEPEASPVVPESAVEEVVEAVAPVSVLEEVPEVSAPVAVAAPRPSFMAAAAPTAADKARGNTRRAVPVETITADTVAPVRQNRPVMNTSPSPVDQRFAASTPYRPEVSLELLPASGEPSIVTLRAEVGGMGNNPALLLEIRTLATESKRLRADNPGSNGGTETPILVLESLTSDAAPEDATTLRLHARESSAPDATTLLEATLETPDALRIKSGKASAAGVPPVRFEVTSEPDGTSRFRATVPPLGDTPALFVDLERTVTEEGRWSRVTIRLA